MDQVIYTFGGGDVLFRVFTALAMLFKSDSAYVTSMFRFSLTIGALWASLLAIYKANIGIFARDWFVPTYAILSLLLVPKVTVHVVDLVNPDHRYHQIAHVPVGVALVASVTSTLSKGMAERLETVLEPVGSVRYGITGPLFGARLVALSRDVRIHDPVIRDDLKQFVHQCFTLPFVWTNILAGAKAARESTDILGLIKNQGHPALGSYWRAHGNRSTFLSCREGAEKARTLLQVEIPKGLFDLAQGLFGADTRSSERLSESAVSQRLTGYSGSAWSKIAGQTAEAHQIVGQQMMMNTYREALDDMKQKYGMDRIHPELIASSATRARAQQNNSFLISAQAVTGFLPSLQSTMLAMLSLLFVVVLPMAFLPGGLKTLGTWIKLIIWVESWPMFFAVVNGVAQNIAASQGVQYAGTGAGLSLATQNGLADAAWDAWCYAEGLMALVPAISWAVLSGGGYALANLSSSVTRSIEGLSSKLGSDMVDGNISVDTHSLHGRSIANAQIAQQQLGASHSFGQTFSDGHLTSTYTPQGNAVFNENQSNLGTHVVSTESLAASLTESGSRAHQTALQKSAQSSQSFHQGMNELYSYADQYSKSQGLQERFGNTREAGEGQDWKNTLDTAHKFAQDNKISDDKSFQILAKAGVNTGFLKSFGIDIGAESNAFIRAGDAELTDKAKSSGMADQFGHHLNSALKHSTGQDGSLSDQAQKNVSDSIQGNFNTAKQYQDQAQASFSESENYSKAASLVESQGGSITTNLDSDVLSYVAQKRGMSEEQVARWQSTHKGEFAAEANAFLAGKLQPFISSLKSSSPLSEGQIRDKASQFFGAVPNTVGHSDVDAARAKSSQEGINPTKGWDDLSQKTGILKNNTQTSFKDQTDHIRSAQKNLHQGYQNLEAGYDQRKSDGVLIGGAKHVAENIPLVKSIGAEALKPEDFGSGTSSYVHNLNEDIAQHQAKNKLSSQGRELRHLKETIESEKENTSSEGFLPLMSSTKVEG